MEAVSCLKSQMSKRLFQTVFGDRGSQFVDRLCWSLTVTPSGCELDEYDDDNSTYLAIHRDSDHLGSCRVRSCQHSMMLTDHFLDCFPEAENFVKMQRGRVFELTRFCRSPDISVLESKEMLRHLAKLLDDFRLERQIVGYLAVVYPPVARFLDTIGVRYLLVSKSSLCGKPIYLICITQASNPRLPAPRSVKSNADSTFVDGQSQRTMAAAMEEGKALERSVVPMA